MLRFLAVFLAAAAAWGANCGRTSVGLTPFTDPFPKAYHGREVSLYPGGSARPAGHEKLGLQVAAQIRPRDAAGNPDPDGQIVLLSVGMSNTTQEFSAFLSLAQADPMRAPRVRPVDGAQGGRTAASIAQQPDTYWSVVDQRLQAARATAAQVQAIWLKQADAGPTQAFPLYPQTLQSEIQTVIEQARARFPNLKIVYLSSRIYAGYADTSLNPEPWAYESAFAVKWLIEKQISGAAEMDAASGKFPWLAWGPYLWADGLTPRASDGLSWSCSDLVSDGTHPSTDGRRKVAGMLLDFLHSDSTARPWYLARKTAAVPAIGAVLNSAGWDSAVATGSLATIYGTNLAASAAQALSLPLPHELAGTRVEMNGVPLPLYFASPTQINFVMPLGGGSLTVAQGDSVSQAVASAPVFWAPGLYTLDGTRNGPAAAQFADGITVNPFRRARSGDTIQLYGTGLGFVNPLLLVATPEPVILVGGMKAQVTYCGPAPSLPGVTQINFVVPDGVPQGAATLVFQLGTAASNVVTLPIS